MLSLSRALAAGLLLIVLAGCGYNFSSVSPISLPRGHRLICLTQVTNPSMNSWLEPMIRAEVRDEFTRRGQVRWVDRNEAESLMKINVESFTAGSSVKGESDRTLKRSVDMSLQADIFDAKENNLIWSSGRIRVNESFTSKDGEQGAALQAVQLAAEKLADRLADKF